MFKLIGTLFVLLSAPIGLLGAFFGICGAYVGLGVDIFFLGVLALVSFTALPPMRWLTPIKIRAGETKRPEDGLVVRRHYEILLSPFWWEGLPVVAKVIALESELVVWEAQEGDIELIPVLGDNEYSQIVAKDQGLSGVRLCVPGGRKSTLVLQQNGTSLKLDFVIVWYLSLNRVIHIPIRKLRCRVESIGDAIDPAHFNVQITGE